MPPKTYLKISGGHWTSVCSFPKFQESYCLLADESVHKEHLVCIFNMHKFHSIWFHKECLKIGLKTSATEADWWRSNCYVSWVASSNPKRFVCHFLLQMACMLVQQLLKQLLTFKLCNRDSWVNRDFSSLAHRIFFVPSICLQNWIPPASILGLKSYWNHYFFSTVNS